MKTKILKRLYKLLLPIGLIVLITSSFLFGLIYEKVDNLEPAPEIETETSSIKCNRETPYKLAPEFERARSLRNQRVEQNGNKLDYSFYNCLNIEYADLSSEGAEGVFMFDETSTIDNLKILVDYSYQATDDISTAILLAHEMAHVSQFIDELRNGTSLSCVDKEVQAFFNQLLFTTYLNEEEQLSIISRVEKPTNNPQLLQYLDLLDISWDAINPCRDNDNSFVSSSESECYKKNLERLLRKSIVNNPAYREQCGL